MNKGYCYSYYETGYVPAFWCKIYCKNSITGEEKYICDLDGFAKFGERTATKAACEVKVPNISLSSTSGDMSGSCNSDGTRSCGW